MSCAGCCTELGHGRSLSIIRTLGSGGLRELVRLRRKLSFERFDLMALTQLKIKLKKKSVLTSKMSAIFHSKQERQTNKLNTPTADTAYFVFTLNSQQQTATTLSVSVGVSSGKTRLPFFRLSPTVLFVFLIGRTL